MTKLFSQAPSARLFRPAGRWQEWRILTAMANWIMRCLSPDTRRTAIWYLSGASFSLGRLSARVCPTVGTWGSGRFQRRRQTRLPARQLAAISLSPHRDLVSEQQCFHRAENIGPHSAGWLEVVGGVADFNGDGKPDFLLSNIFQTRVQTAIWYLSE